MKIFIDSTGVPAQMGVAPLFPFHNTVVSLFNMLYNKIIHKLTGG